MLLTQAINHTADTDNIGAAQNQPNNGNTAHADNTKTAHKNNTDRPYNRANNGNAGHAAATS